MASKSKSSTRKSRKATTSAKSSTASSRGTTLSGATAPRETLTLATKTETTTAEAPVADATSTEVEAAKDTPATSDATSDEMNVVEVLNKKAFLNKLAERTGLRPNKTREIVDAAFAELVDALLRGDSVKIPALGEISVNRHVDKEKHDVLVCKLRRKKPSAEDGPDGDDADDDADDAVASAAE